jgi:hypothetical protein
MVAVHPGERARDYRRLVDLDVALLQAAHRPNERPMISFMISVVPP